MSYYKEIPPEIHYTSEESLSEFVAKAEDTTHAHWKAVLQTLLLGFQWLYKEAVEVCEFHGFSYALIRVFLYEKRSLKSTNQRWFVFFDGAKIHRGFCGLSEPDEAFGQSYLVSQDKPGRDVVCWKVPRTIQLQQKFPTTHESLLGHYLIPCARWLYEPILPNGRTWKDQDTFTMSYNRLVRCAVCDTLRIKNCLAPLPFEGGEKNVCTGCWGKVGFFQCGRCYQPKPLTERYFANFSGQPRLVSAWAWALSDFCCAQCAPEGAKQAPPNIFPLKLGPEGAKSWKEAVEQGSLTLAEATAHMVNSLTPKERQLLKQRFTPKEK